MATPTQLFSLEGKVALVTGGSRGLGLQMAQALAEQGAKLMLVARNKERLQSVVENFHQLTIDCDYCDADISLDEDIDKVVQHTLSRFSQIDILVNNAGTTWGAQALDYPITAWDKVMQLNVRSAFLLSQKVVQQSMLGKQWGRIINIASIAGLRANPLNAIPTVAYNTSKAAIINMTRALAAEWGKHGITVNAIAPGIFHSKMTEQLIAQYGEEKLTRNIPLQRLGDSEDLKGPVVLLASDAGKHITGQVISVDGGASIV